MKHYQRLIVATAIATVALLLLASPAAATVVTFTSTADFDAGTKSSASGNYQVETITDNLQIASGSLELSSLKSDTFTFADSDAITRKWTTAIGGGSGVCSTTAIASGVATLAAVNAGSAKACDMVSASTFSGSWDVRVKVAETSGTFNTATFCMITTQECTSGVDRAYSGSANGVYIRHLIGTLTVWSVASGTPTQQGSNVALTAGTFWLRLTRSSTTYTAYHSADGSSWTQDVQYTDAGPSGTRYGGFGIFRNGDAYGSVSDDFDDWNVAAGTVDSGGYATAGAWVSASQSAITDAFRQIVIEYSGASGANFITSVYLVDSTSNYFYIDNTDLTSGSSHTYAVPNPTNTHTWKVGFNLTSGGAGTPNVQDIAVTFAETAPTITGYGTTPTSGTHAAIFHFFATYSDSDNDAPTYFKLQIVSGANSTMTANDTGDMTYTDGKSYYLNSTFCPGSYTYFFSTSDGILGIKTSPSGSFTVTNTAPAITNGASAPGTVESGGAYRFDFAASDIDAPSCQTLTWSKFAGPSWLSVDPSTGVISGAAPATPGDAVNYTVRVSDGTAHVDVTVSVLVEGITCRLNTTIPGGIGLLEIIIGVGILVSVVGVLLAARGQAQQKGGTLALFVGVIISLVILFSFLAVVLPSLNCGG
jgi:hypothetical protein